jgi:hypothetical protein
MTTSSGGRGVRSRDRSVEERGDDGVKSPKEPKAPNSVDKLKSHQSPTERVYGDLPTAS